jgi:hypothetical protein
MTKSYAGFPDEQSFQAGWACCHSVLWCRALMLTFKDPDISINA